jgi:NAD(P)-dependent dehydrogenase (short-subunit alcohol dehydrogenase family)/pimeloyl-ACP methyl ester carboxylesterase
VVEGAVNRTVVRDGVTLAVVEAGERSRPTIVFVHGYPDTKAVWGPVFERLAPEFHVVAYDVRGAGASSAPRGPAAYGLEQLAADFAAVCDAVAPGGRVHLVGHDWGGIQGWEFVTASSFEGRIASFTTIAGPSLGHVVRATREPLTHAHLLSALGRMRRSWYVAPLCLPGGPSFAWRVLLGGDRWRQLLVTAERLPVDAHFPAATVTADGLHGSNLYRRNIPPRLLGLRLPARGEGSRAHAPVQLIVPAGDRFISESYYEPAERVAPGLRRRAVAGSHWAQRSQPELVARWVGEFVREAETGDVRPSHRWVRGGGTEQLAGRLALVTGAGSGIGFATASALAEHGARVVLVDRDVAALARAAEAIPGSRSLECDVSDAGAMERLVAELLDSAGVPDVVVNNAGIAIAGPFLDTGVAEWRRIVDVNLLGVVHGCRLFGRAMVQHGEGGQIVNIASAAAFTPSKTLPAYSATKAAVLMLSECLRAELGPHGIGVTAVCPGIVATNITRAAQYVGRPESDEQRLREHVTRLCERRNFTPEQVAKEIVAAIAVDKAIAVVTPEAKVMRAMSRFAPALTRRLARLDALPI